MKTLRSLILFLRVTTMKLRKRFGQKISRFIYWMMMKRTSMVIIQDNTLTHTLASPTHQSVDKSI